MTWRLEFPSVKYKREKMMGGEMKQNVHELIIGEAG